MIDVANISVIAGKGGDGAVSFLRQKFKPKGGPDGGDGGRGGSVVLLGNHNLATLKDFRAKTVFKAGNGQPGMGKKQYGEDGDDLIIELPTGVLVYELENDKEILVADITKHGERVEIARGGLGGRGNTRFKSSTNRTPKQYTKGTFGEKKELKLEVKLIADVGLVGAPNAGKSTLLNTLTNSNAKVASYPFTTLSPNLGVVTLKDGQNVVLSDIPGLIEGASEGKGLGDDFLRHVERTRLLVHLIDPFQLGEEDLSDIAISRYKMIQKELKDYKVDLTEKVQIVAINKMDITEVANNFNNIREKFKEIKVDVVAISASTGDGVEELLDLVSKKIVKIPKKPLVTIEKPVKRYTINNLPNRRIVYGAREVFELS